MRGTQARSNTQELRAAQLNAAYGGAPKLERQPTTEVGRLHARIEALEKENRLLKLRLEPLPADLGASWGDLGAVFKALGAMRVKFIDFMTPRSAGGMVPPPENPACSGALAAV